MLVNVATCTCCSCVVRWGSAASPCFGQMTFVSWQPSAICERARDLSCSVGGFWWRGRQEQYTAAAGS